MKYRKLGRSGLHVSELCLGTMMFGGVTDEPTSRNIIARAQEAGVNFIDTADIYVRGRSEEITGRAIAGKRHAWVVATKFGGGPMGERPGPNERGLSRKWMFREIEGSLQRLGTDYIDIYYLHREDPQTPMEETCNALADLMGQGKIRYFGISNHQSWKIAEFSHLADERGIDRPVVSQLCYNIVNRQPEKEHFYATEHYGLGVAAYSPLARGVLTGKYQLDAPPPPGTRAGRKDPRMLQAEWRKESLVIAQRLKTHAEARGISASEFAMAWALNSEAVTSVIAGPRTEEQWDIYAKALNYRITPEDEVLVDSLVVPGTCSTPGFNDPVDLPARRAPRRIKG